MTDKQIERARIARNSFIYAENQIIERYTPAVNRVLHKRQIRPSWYIFNPQQMTPEFNKATIWQGLNIPRNVFNPAIFTSPRKGLFILVPLKDHPNASLVIPISFKYFKEE